MYSKQSSCHSLPSVGIVGLHHQTHSRGGMLLLKIMVKTLVSPSSFLVTSEVTGLLCHVVSPQGTVFS